jgi:type II secretory pathway component PulC
LPSTSPTTTTAPTTAATTTSPSEIAATPPFPKDYDLLLKRSMFMRGPPKPDKSAGGNAQSPEGNFGLRGVGVQDGQFVAIIEESSSKSSKSVKQGESVATGKIKSIDIDGMVYEGGGKTTKVAIGQNLLGAPLPQPPQPAPKPPEQPQGAQPGQPGQPGQPPQPGQPGGPQPGRRGR